MWDEYESALLDVQSIISKVLISSPALGSSCKLCHWYSHCKDILVEEDDLTLIPELGRNRREKLESTVKTVEELAELETDKFILR